MYVKTIVKAGKRDIKPDGRVIIYFALREKGQPERLIDSEKKIFPKHFDNNTGMPKKSAPNYLMLKKWLTDKIIEIEGMILELENSGRVVTTDMVRERYLAGDLTFVVAFCEQELEQQKPHIAYKTWEDYRRCINNLKEYKPNTRFSEVDEQYLKDYQYYLQHVKGLKKNSVAHDFRTIRKFFNIANKKGITAAYPFDHFKITTEDTIKEYCTPDEVERLDQLFHSGTLPLKLQKTLSFFLFSCYTGISGDDLRHKERLQFEEDIVRFIRGKTKRKGKITYIPLTTKAQRLLPFIQAHKLKMKIARVHEDLKEIMDIAGVDKHITFHTARNSFYVIGKRAGMDDRAISEILGHSTITTTEKYKRIEDSYIRDQMHKMDLSR